MNLNGKQVISIIGAILGVLMISTTQLTDLFGAGVAKNVVSIAALVNTVLSSVMAVITSQGGIVRDVLAMPGIENIAVNGRANQTLAAIAIDPLSDKIAPTASAQAQVTRTAQAA